MASPQENFSVQQRLEKTTINQNAESWSPISINTSPDTPTPKTQGNTAEEEVGKLLEPGAWGVCCEAVSRNVRKVLF